MRLARITQLDITVSGGEATLNGALPGAGAIVVLQITGPGVSTRAVSEQDPILKRVMANPDILYTTYPDRVCYVPKGPVTELTASWKDIPVAGIIVSDGMVETASVVSEIERNIPSAMMAGQWYERLKLPVPRHLAGQLPGHAIPGPKVRRAPPPTGCRRAAEPHRDRSEREAETANDRVLTDIFRRLCLFLRQDCFLCSRKSKTDANISGNRPLHNQGRSGRSLLGRYIHKPTWSLFPVYEDSVL